MNTMELVRFVDHAHPRHQAPRRIAPLFYSELIGPARQAILRARQHLLSEQYNDGSWRGEQSSDASLPSQLIFLLTYLDDDHSSLVQQASTTILDMQMASGGWSRIPNGPVDLNTSVQAYFALKLSGMDVADCRLHRARQMIHQLGGADATDAATRRFLALLGQVSYDCCPAFPPELLYLSDSNLQRQAPLMLMWAHRAVRTIGIDRGVRELFNNDPSDWSAATPTMGEIDGSELPGNLKWIAATFCQFFERRGWMPLRSRAMNRAEIQLSQNISETNICNFDFTQLIWNRIAMQSAGYTPDSVEMARINQRLNDMIIVDEAADRAMHQHRISPLPDTLLVLQSLGMSGLSYSHRSARAALKCLSKLRRNTSPTSVAELASILRMLCVGVDAEFEKLSILPPAMEVAYDDFARFHGTGAIGKLLNRLRPTINATIEQILRQQQADGGWGSDEVTGDVLDAISSANFDDARPAIDRAIAILRVSQNADGSWTSSTGASDIRATASAVLGLSTAGVANDDEVILRGLNWLSAHLQIDARSEERVSVSHLNQADEGDKTRTAATTAWDAAWTLRAFVAAAQSNHRTASRSVRILIDLQSETGGFSQVFFANPEVPFQRSVRSLPHINACALVALSRWAVAAMSAQSAATDSISLRLVASATDN